MTRTTQFVGTRRYAGPEQQIDARSIDRRADVYSLGATLWELLALRPLFDATDDTPLPVRLTFWGLPVALSVTVTVPVSVPVVAGLKTTLNVQLAPAASVLMHVAPGPK